MQDGQSFDRYFKMYFIIYGEMFVQIVNVIHLIGQIYNFIISEKEFSFFPDLGLSQYIHLLSWPLENMCTLYYVHKNFSGLKMINPSVLIEFRAPCLWAED